MDSMPLTLGEYELESEIGHGGMGVVWLARQRTLNRRVALKVLPREFTRDEGRLRRFRREAAVVSRLDHPHIVPVYDVGEDQGLHFIAMKYVPGTPLDLLIRARARGSVTDGTPSTAVLTPSERRAACEPSGELRISDVDADDLADAHTPRPRPRAQVEPPVDNAGERRWLDQCAWIAELVARALAHAHERGVIHRDVKPGNILVDAHGFPWLLDFGLVRELNGESVSDQDVVLGTAQYMSPEQVRGRRVDIDHRTDVYALGVTLYEMVTRRCPFAYPETATILHAIMHEAPTPPGRLNPCLSPDFETVIMKAMAKDPRARYASAAELADDLVRVRLGQPVRARRQSFVARARSFCRGNPVFAFAAVFSILSFAGTVEYGLYRDVTDVRRRTQCREEANAALAAGQFSAAAEGYRLYVRLGGAVEDVAGHLDACVQPVTAASRPGSAESAPRR